jgi:hypothetical protein
MLLAALVDKKLNLHAIQLEQVYLTASIGCPSSLGRTFIRVYGSEQKNLFSA